MLPSIRSRLRLSAVGLVVIGLFASSLWHAAASAAPRNFHMALWQSSERAYTDFDWVEVSPTPVPQSRTTILRLDGWYLVPHERDLLLEMLGNPAYDWSKIAAVFIDEPYLNALTNPDYQNGPKHPVPDNPCGNLVNSTKTVNAEVALATVADRVRTLSPATRFWVNFNRIELDWMHRGLCAASFNQPYIDVISLDYYRPFYDVKPYYDRLKANPATPYQQRALIPLAGHYPPESVDPMTATYWLQGYFEYATAENQTCDLPIGRTGVTGIADRCSVWVVSGWPGVDAKPDGYVGFYDPASAPIRQAWHQQREIIRADQMNLVFDLVHTILDSPNIP